MPPKSLAGAGAERKHALFAALAKDGDTLVLQVEVPNSKAAEFRGTDPGVEEQFAQLTYTKDTRTASVMLSLDTSPQEAVVIVQATEQ